MNQSSDKNPARNPVDQKESRQDDLCPPEELWRSQNRYAGLKLVPWNEIWASIAAAKLRGNTGMLKVFYETLYKEALFDDRGAWSLISRPPD